MTKKKPNLETLKEAEKWWLVLTPKERVEVWQFLNRCQPSKFFKSSGYGHGVERDVSMDSPPDTRSMTSSPEIPEGKTHVGEFTCDNCSTKTDFASVQLDFGYGSENDGDRQIFCSDKCFYEWVSKTTPICETCHGTGKLVK